MTVSDRIFMKNTVKKDTDAGRLMADYQKLDPHFRERILGYAEAIIAMNQADSNY